MKKLLLIFSMIIVFLFLNGCSDSKTNANTSSAESMYSQLSGFKGIELYVWRENGNKELYFGFLEGTNRNKGNADFELLYQNPVTLAKEKEILSTYKKDMYVFITPLKIELTDDELADIKTQFNDLEMPNISYPNS